jgi:hypothetical protein
MINITIIIMVRNDIVMKERGRRKMEEEVIDEIFGGCLYY